MKLAVDEIRNDLTELHISVDMKYQGFEINNFLGDIFKLSAPNSSLAHCVSRDFKMSKGFAEKFKKKFGRLEELRRAKARIGETVVLKEGRKYLYYLVTKQKYFDKPTNCTLKQALIQMKNHAVKNNVTEISMPRIGCGRDNLNWDEVRQIITHVFSETRIRISVYQLNTPGKRFYCLFDHESE